MDDDKNYLSYFLGPKAENANFLEELLLLVLRDYFHWRRNYFPGDKILLTKKIQRELESNYDSLYQNTLELTAELRRNFPFYSSRYLAHMLSDTSIPSIVGYLAGMLYNPNNVTPEAAPVTVDLEIEACNEILRMLGYSAPPDIPSDFDKESIAQYKKELQKEFGWAHITQGGTIANIEALWIARSIKYTPLSIWDISRKENLEIQVKLPNGSQKDIKNLSKIQILSIKPNESIYLLAKYVEAIRNKYKIGIEEADTKSQLLLTQSEYSINKGIGKILKEFPPTIFISGTAHYSITKAADILGIGKENIRIIKTDSKFRIDVNDLEQEINYCLARKHIPLAVIAIVGTTEEGAVDPVHKILDLREIFESQKNISFWLHTDAAWGGYIKSLFTFSNKGFLKTIQNKISEQLKLNSHTNPFEWTEEFISYVYKNINEYLKKNPDDEKYLRTDIQGLKEQLINYITNENVEAYFSAINHFITDHKYLQIKELIPELNLEKRVEIVNNFVCDEVKINWDDYLKNVSIQWGDFDVCSSFIAISKTDSTTIDPHKMGYINYPCGIIAFKNDRVRHFILQKAPYITSVRQDVLIHMPPRHLENIDQEPKIVTEAFAPFIIEGSRPGAAATSLWSSIKTIPPDMDNMGQIIKTSLIASRELYEWLNRWANIVSQNVLDVDFQFVPFNISPPDLNLVIFGVKKKSSNSLEKMNRLSQLVYDNFSIQSELGDREYSYSQPFFLSKTTFHSPEYSFDAIKPILEKYFEKNSFDNLLKTFNKEGLTVLRATVMNPYITQARKLSEQYIIKEFMEELTDAAKKCTSLI